MIIWKYELTTSDRQSVMMPKGAQILSVQVQNHTPCLWVLCDEMAAQVQRQVLTLITGTQIAPEDADNQFVGTYQMNDGSFVGHVFDMGEIE